MNPPEYDERRMAAFRAYCASEELGEDEREASNAEALFFAGFDASSRHEVETYMVFFTPSQAIAVRARSAAEAERLVRSDPWWDRVLDEAEDLPASQWKKLEEEGL